MALRKEDVVKKDEFVEQLKLNNEVQKIDELVKSKESEMLDSPKYAGKLNGLLEELTGEPAEKLSDPFYLMMVVMPKIKAMADTEEGKEKIEKLMHGYKEVKDEALQELAANDQNYFNAKIQDMNIKVLEQDLDDVPKSIKDRNARRKPLYKLDMFSDEELKKTKDIVFAVATSMGGLINDHTEVKRKKGWMRPWLIGYDTLLWGRWMYWLDILDKDSLAGSGPIPQIEWSTDHEGIHQVRKMLHECMDGVYNEGVHPEDFADWLMWGLGIAERPANIKSRVNKYWYEKFDLALVLMYPTDYLSGLLEDLSSKGDKSARGYFSTPMDVTKMMTEMVLSKGDPEQLNEQLKYQTINDPCVGCGAMLLPASNFFLFGSGQDINMTSVKFTKIQMMWYAPWFAINPFSPS